MTELIDAFWMLFALLAHFVQFGATVLWVGFLGWLLIKLYLKVDPGDGTASRWVDRIDAMEQGIRRSRR